MTELTTEQINIVSAGIRSTKDLCDIVHKELEGKSSKINLRTVVMFSLFMRVEDLFRGIIACSEVKKPVASMVLIRTMCEAFVLLKGCVEDEGFCNKFINKGIDKKLGRLRKIKKDLPMVGFSFDEKELDNLFDKTKQDKLNASTMPDAYQVFEQFGCLQLYHQVFAHCSLHAHTDPTSLDDYIVQTDSDLFLDYNKKTYSDLILSLLMAMSLYLHTFEQLLKFIVLDSPRKEEMAKKYNEFHDLARGSLGK